jgi:hypothetical protein
VTTEKTAYAAGEVRCPKCDGATFTAEVRDDDALVIACDSPVCGAWSLDLNQWTPDQWDDEWVTPKPESGAS